MVTWEDERNGTDNQDIYAQRYASDGTPLGSNFKVNDDQGSSEQFSPAVSMDENGNFVIWWEDIRNGESYGTYAQRYLSDGTALGRNFRISEQSGVVSTDRSGNFVFTWVDTRKNYDGDIYVQRYSSDGTALGHNFRVNDEIESVANNCPSVSTDGSGNFVITWSYEVTHGESDDAIYAQRYSSDGTAIGSNFKVNDKSR